MSNRTHYFDKARNWAVDTRSQDATSRKVAWTVAGCAVAVALFEAVAIMLLTPLKTVQPVTLLVDRQTGYVQTIDPSRPSRIGADAALTQSLLAQYVEGREGFDRATVRADYRRVALWSAGTARKDYLMLMPATNPMSPFTRYPAGTTIVARVKSVSPLSDGTALVRFDTQQQGRSGGLSVVQPWISVVHYRYASGPMSFEDRLVNPLGFQVTGYRRDAEAPVEQPATPQPASGAQTPSLASSVVPVGNIVYSTPSAGRTATTAVRDVPLTRIPMGSPLERRTGRP
jgi:type IV secretion system protein VirB8